MSFRFRKALPGQVDLLFSSYMTLADLYRYPTRHFRHHQRQLTLGAAGTAQIAEDPRR